MTSRRRRVSGVPILLAATAITAGCTIAPATETPTGGPDPVSVMPPRGYGSLLQSEVSMTLASRDLEIMVTPLDESVIRVTAPDTENRLRGIAAANRGPATRTSLSVGMRKSIELMKHNLSC